MIAFHRGELKIAEVASRFATVDDFVSLVRDVGFKLKKKVGGSYAAFALAHVLNTL